MKKYETFFYCFVLGSVIALYALFTVNKLDSNRQQLEQVRIELSDNESRLDRVTEIVDRTRANLSISASTISELRGQIAEVREVFEEMEDCLHSSSLHCRSDSSE